MNLNFDPLNRAYIETLEKTWREDPALVPKMWRLIFEGEDNQTPDLKTDEELSRKQSRVDSLIWAYRDIGYLYASLNPLKGYLPKDLEYVYISVLGNYEKLTPEGFGLSDTDLDSPFSFKRGDTANLSLSEIIAFLKKTYCSYIGVEILHIQNKPIRKWLIRNIEAKEFHLPPKKMVVAQRDLIKTLEFERFLHTRFVGQKRFSVEGSEAVISALHYLIDTSADNGIEEITIGMSHRGRLNVLANIMGKPLDEIFAKFEESSQVFGYGESGDVRYHLGYSCDHLNDDGTQVHISLVANPSHLESVDPVVQGKVRGIQMRRGDNTRKKVVPVLLHGDAAFSGQGVVAETLNLSKLKGYETGGTIHIILNNQIGFTTASRDLRSTFFPTDTAKAMPVPIFHVNGQKVAELLGAMDLALRFRQKFGYDVIVDIVCYRKYGHNEGDEPSFTHPLMYSLIKEAPDTASLFGNYLAEKDIYPKEEQEDFRTTYRESLKKAFLKAEKGAASTSGDGYKAGDWQGFNRQYSHKPVSTGVSEKVLTEIGEMITKIPEKMKFHPKLVKIIASRRETVEKGEGIDWATGESLAFGSLLLDGYPIRLSGEDSCRGTFSQRHAVWWNTAGTQPEAYVPLNNIRKGQEAFNVYDSPLSEFAVLGFEFGNSLAQPGMLCIWEAQFGDFCNGAQVIIDQFITSSEIKWDRASGLVMLLPHGYEGQGPEHSNAFPERFLQLAAMDNIQVVNVTTPAQYFHLLRRQMKRNFRKPLVIMAPKSLLRKKEAVSPLADFTRGHFSEVLRDLKYQEGTDCESCILCSGKIYYDLIASRPEEKPVPVIRLEQLYPFPASVIKEVLSGYKNLRRIKWVQEEPKNRGAWTFIRGMMEDSGLITPIYIGRAASASPATGSIRQHLKEQEDIVRSAFAAYEK